MKLVTSVFLCIISIVFTGCTTNAPLTGTNKSPILPSKSQADQTPTTHITKAETDTDKTKTLKIGNISELKDDKTCDDVGDILVYAETRSYWVYICGNKQDTSQSSYFFKAKSKNDKDKPSIMGKASLGWRQTSFVGIKDNYTYSIDIPSVRTNSGSYKLPSLDIYPSNVKEITLNPEDVQHELLTKYLSTAPYRQARKFYGQWWSSESDPLLDPKKKKFIKHLMDNRENLQVCENRNREPSERREEGSVLYKLENGKYVLQLRCNVYLKYNSFNFFLISEQANGLEVKFLTQPKDVAKFGVSVDEYEGRIIVGRPLFDPLTRNLSIHVPFSGLSKNGYLSTFTISNEQLELIEFRYADRDDNFYIDPILYPILYP
ncbi:MAG: hypothetical protein ACK54J_09960 [Pseudanabaena sp.]|jgi:hypothetical protein